MAMILNVISSMGIPSPASMIDQSSMIVVGHFQPAGGDTNFLVTETLKGSDISGKLIGVLDPENGREIAFDLQESVRKIGSEETILLGAAQTGNTAISLTWLFASIWPQGHAFATFPSDTFPACKRFIESVLFYNKTEKIDDLAALLLTDVSTARVYAVLDFMDVFLKRHIPEGKGEIEKQVVWSAFCRLVGGMGPIDDYIRQKLLSLFGLLPASVSLPFFLSPEQKAVLSRVPIRPFLKAKGLIPPGEKPGSSELQKLVESNKAHFRREDARVALKMFNSDIDVLRDKYADMVLEKILGEPLSKNVSPQAPLERKKLWEQKIDYGSWD